MIYSLGENKCKYRRKKAKVSLRYSAEERKENIYFLIAFLLNEFISKNYLSRH